MIKSTLSLPEIALIGATRGALGAGIALLLADKLSREERRAVGLTLFAVGALTTIPLVAEVLSHRVDREPHQAAQPRRIQPAGIG